MRSKKYGSITAVNLPTASVRFIVFHIRRQIGAAELFIPLFELKSLLRSHTPGSIALDGRPGFVKNGFALNTPTGYFYGLEENGIVKSLAVHTATGPGRPRNSPASLRTSP